jgi:predicted RNase H-like nuclease
MELINNDPEIVQQPFLKISNFDKKMEVIHSLIETADEKNDDELLNKLILKKKQLEAEKKQLIIEWMDYIDDIKHDMNNKDYLNMCKLIQSMYK